MGTNKVEYFYNLLLDRINLGMKKFMFQNVSSSNSPVQELITTEVIYIQYKNPLNLEDVKQFHLAELLFSGHGFYSNYCTIRRCDCS